MTNPFVTATANGVVTDDELRTLLGRGDTRSLSVVQLGGSARARPGARKLSLSEPGGLDLRLCIGTEVTPCRS